MDALLDQARTIWEGEIDFAGQSLAETLQYTLLTLTGLLAFFAGYISGDIYKTLYVGLGGTGLAFLVVVPPWPVYNRKPEKWLPPAKGASGYGDVRVVAS
ncbi:hypothetical protein MBLNU230_g2672t1 [Neophaeotheca triangularis]